MKKQKQKQSPLFMMSVKSIGCVVLVLCGVSLGGGNSWSSFGAIPPIHHPITFQSPNTSQFTQHTSQFRTQCTTKVQHTNQIRHTTQTQHTLTLRYPHTPLLCSVLFCSALFCFPPHPPMDCWYSPHPLHDEFEKLVIRMNPPRSNSKLSNHFPSSSFLVFFFFFMQLNSVLHVMFLQSCRG